jgi:hypothetical protein
MYGKEARLAAGRAKVNEGNGLLARIINHQHAWRDRRFCRSERLLVKPLDLRRFFLLFAHKQGKNEKTTFNSTSKLGLAAKISADRQDAPCRSLITARWR